eukprot:scaffold66354_cov63-Phaeocystis_antarctica.AAC.5
MGDAYDLGAHGRSRSESLSTAPVGAKKAMFAEKSKPAVAPALTHTDESARGNKKWKQETRLRQTCGRPSSIAIRRGPALRPSETVSYDDRRATTVWKGCQPWSVATSLMYTYVTHVAVVLPACPSELCPSTIVAAQAGRSGALPLGWSTLRRVAWPWLPLPYSVSFHSVGRDGAVPSGCSERGRCSMSCALRGGGRTTVVEAEACAPVATPSSSAASSAWPCRVTACSTAPIAASPAARICCSVAGWARAVSSRVASCSWPWLRATSAAKLPAALVGRVAEGVRGVEVGTAAEHQRDRRGAARLRRGVQCRAAVVVERVDVRCEAVEQRAEAMQLRVIWAQRGVLQP